jgi:hypothetical protein
VVLFGGFDEAGDPLGDTWVWNGTTWTPLDPPHSPSPRYGMAMVYDAARREVVLFGSQTPELTDTWTWDGRDWHQEFPADSPDRAYGAAMAYDASRREVVLFTDHFDDSLGDTWTWDGAEWTPQDPPDPLSVPRAFPGMAFHGPSDEVVLFGGETDCGDLGCDATQETATWDGSTWTLRSPATSPEERARMGLTSGKLVVLFGGAEISIGGEGVLGDTWVWNGRRWIPLFPTDSPPARHSMGMTYDWARREVVLFGGRLDFFVTVGDTWTFDGRTWTEA